MLALKLAGSVLIIGATTLIGVFYSQRYEGRATDLLEMKKALTILKNEIRFAMTPFGEAALEVSKRVRSPVAEIFMAAGEAALGKEKAAASEIWESAVNDNISNSYFSKADIDTFQSLGNNLGVLDKQMQNQSVDLLIEHIDSEVSAIKENGEKQSRMYRSVGVLSGILIAVMLL